MEKQADERQIPLTHGANLQDAQQQSTLASATPDLSLNGQATTSRGSFIRLFKGIRPLDISASSVLDESDVPDDENEPEKVVITDLGPTRWRPSFSALTRLTRAQRLLAAAITTTLVLSMLATGLLVLPRLTPAPAAPLVPRVLLQAANLGNLSLPAWGERPTPGRSFVGCVAPLPTSSTLPQTGCTPVSIRHGDSNVVPYLSFMDDWGNCYTWSKGMPQPTKSITLKSASVFLGDSSSAWRWLYPGHYLLSYEQTPGAANTYKIWDTVQNRLIFTTTDTQPFAIRPDGTIATLTSQHTVQILHTQDLFQKGNSQGVIQPQNVAETLSSPLFAQLVALSWSPSGSELATASSDGTIQMWGTVPAIKGSAPLFRTLHVALSQTHAPPFSNFTIVWSPDERHLAVSASNDTGSTPIQIWDLRSKQVIQSYSGNVFPVITGMVWLDDNRTMLINSFNQLVLWDTTTGRTMMSVQQGMAYLPGQAQQSPLSPNEHLLAFPLAYSIQLIDAQTGRLVRTLQSSFNKDYFVATAFSTDNRHLAALDIYGQIQVWNIQSGQRETSYKLSENLSQKSQQSPTWTYYYQNGGVATLTMPMGSIGDIAWSPDGSMLAATYKTGMVVLGIPQLP